MALLREWGLTLGRWTGRTAAVLERDSGEPEVTRVRAAAEAGDWAGVRAVLEARPESGDRAELLMGVADTAGVEGWIGGAVDAEPDSALPKLVAGLRQVCWGWEARSGLRAQHVSREQFQVFHERLRTAETWLYEVAEREPSWSSPWYGLLMTGRGLEIGQVTVRRRFEAAVRRDPYHLGVHQQQLQQLCEKWGGSHEAMHAFARESAFGAPAGTALGQLVALAHLEHWLALDSGADSTYIRRPDVVAELHRAADHSYRHPEFAPRTGRLQIANSFAMAFSLAGERDAARECFEATGGRVTEFPWQYLDNDPVAAYRRQRSAAGR
ncbi:hypothetical protein [Streptomyces sp. NPDC051909]|uniref:hypothetical protein n=1 Tax=Streptomyces sp. NPDC051909 TaxID=3154944 RepID=UPI0034235D9B